MSDSRTMELYDRRGFARGYGEDQVLAKYVLVILYHFCETLSEMRTSFFR
jgi:hypothetical protein